MLYYYGPQFCLNTPQLASLLLIKVGPPLLQARFLLSGNKFRSCFSTIGCRVASDAMQKLKNPLKPPYTESWWVVLLTGKPHGNTYRCCQLRISYNTNFSLLSAGNSFCIHFLYTWHQNVPGFVQVEIIFFAFASYSSPKGFFQDSLE